jgi:hypothetical protein
MLYSIKSTAEALFQSETPTQAFLGNEDMQEILT